MRSPSSSPKFLGLLLFLLVGLGCGCDNATPKPRIQEEDGGGTTEGAAGERKLLPVDTSGVKADLTGKIQVDGSSTVYKISQLAAEEFGAVSKVDISVGYVGTGGGFKSFPDPAKGLDVCDASRPIQEKELTACVDHGVNFLELPIGIDAITIIVSANNDFVHEITLDELKKLWAPTSPDEPKGAVTKWSQVREGWPDEPVSLYGADTASGTFEYFNEAVHKDKKVTRNDYTSNSNDNVLIQGVEKSKFALGYIPYAYYAPRTKTLRAVKIKTSADAEGMLPSPATISSGDYHPFARPLFIYVNAQSLERPEVASFVEFYVKNAGALCNNAGYIPFDAPVYAKVHERLANRELGTAFGGKLKEDLDMTTIMDLPVSYPEKAAAGN